jgi:hypothetical protein
MKENCSLKRGTIPIQTKCASKLMDYTQPEILSRSKKYTCSSDPREPKCLGPVFDSDLLLYNQTEHGDGGHSVPRAEEAQPCTAEALGLRFKAIINHAEKDQFTQPGNCPRAAPQNPSPNSDLVHCREKILLNATS